MDNGPFRMPHRVHRNEDDSPEPKYKLEGEEPKSVREETKVNRTNRYLNENKSRAPLVVVAVVIVVLLVGVLGWWLWSNKVGGTGIDGSKYQAVFFTNGQVYFGKLSMLNDKYLQLNDIYYLQAATGANEDQKLQKASDSAATNNVQMVKLGEEIHGPQDTMVINRDQVLFYENLKDDGKVVKAISQYKTTNK